LTEGGELVAIVERADESAAVVDAAARAIGAAFRGLALEAWPELRAASRTARSKAALLRRVARFLDAFAASHASAVVVLRGADILATGGAALDPLRLDRLAFLRKRLDAEATRLRGRSSHAELAADDVFARSFWFGAYFVSFFDRPYALDFVRHRARAVTRELSLLLPHLLEEPTDPVLTSPKP
jgi:hypothetical protein